MKKRYSAVSLNLILIAGENTQFQDLLPANCDLQLELEQQDLRDIFREILISPQYRCVHPRTRKDCNLSNFVALKLEGKTLQEIAEQFNISPGYAASLWARTFLPILQEILADFR